MTAMACQNPQIIEMSLPASFCGQTTLPSGQRNSLDFRLRDAHKMSSRIIEFLDDLAEALEDGQCLCCPFRQTLILFVCSAIDPH